MKKADFFRRKYPKFIYRNYAYKISGRNLEIFFDFALRGFEQKGGFSDIKFRPKIVIKNIDRKRLAGTGERALDNLVFHLGLMEIPSYWKATCSPEIEIRAGFLNPEQIKWWKDTIIRGMGQFFYENRIDWRSPEFLKITSTNHKAAAIFRCPLKNRYLVPLGGGRDAIVTLELLEKQNKKINAFLVNPTRAAKQVLKVAKIKNPVIVERKIDPALLKLNKNGYLNGHTPFTAVLSFLAVTCAALFDYKNIAFSLEKSANEGNVRYLGKIINHQWAKSSEFERKFKDYCKKYLIKNLNYFSPLRPYTELQISKMFTKHPQYFSVFSSCNAGIKTGERWCGNCPKCLFVYATLYPFLEKKELLKIFGRDIFENKRLLPTMKGLLGQGRPKPFECVGTKKESRLAFSLSLKKAKKTGKIPYLLTKPGNL
jgi:hypothetical protein